VDAPRHSDLLLVDGNTSTSGSCCCNPLKATARPAFLSCETSVPRLELTEASLALPTALLANGFAAVVATQWALLDTPGTAALVADSYRGWQEDHLEPRRGCGRRTAGFEIPQNATRPPPSPTGVSRRLR
jgi:CHAT domain-containing protein